MDDGAPPLLSPHSPSAPVRPSASAAVLAAAAPAPEGATPAGPLPLRPQSPPRSRLQEAILVPHRMIRWVYLGRFSVATAIFLAAQLVWSSAPTTDTRIASLIFAV